jgi:hypothetical protein
MHADYGRLAQVGRADHDQALAEELAIPDLSQLKVLRLPLPA